MNLPLHPSVLAYGPFKTLLVNSFTSHLVHLICGLFAHPQPLAFKLVDVLRAGVADRQHGRLAVLCDGIGAESGEFVRVGMTCLMALVGNSEEGRFRNLGRQWL